MRGARRAPLIGLVAMALGATVWACGQREPDEELPAGPSIEIMELGRLGGRIYNEPERSRELLYGAGLTPEAFERQVRAVKTDSALARGYALGFQAVLRPRPARPVVHLPPAVSDTVFVGPTRAPRRSMPAAARRATPPPATGAAPATVPTGDARIPLATVPGGAPTPPVTVPTGGAPPPPPVPPDTARTRP